MGYSKGIIVLAEFIGEHHLAGIEIHFNQKKYQASNVFLQVQREHQEIRSMSGELVGVCPGIATEILHFTVGENLINDIWHYRAQHSSEHPYIDILITHNSRRAFIKDAMLTEWSDRHMCAIVDKVKFLTEDTYTLATDPKIQKNFIRSKQINDATFNRFYQILLEE